MARKFKKVEGGHGHHGGAWKVAYADFVTAMMALFMVMWLLASTDQKSRQEISNYFRTGILPEGDLAMDHAAQLRPSVIEEASRPPPPDEAATMESNKADAKSLADKLGRLAVLDDTLSDIIRNVKITVTPEGVLVETVDEDKGLLFDLASAQLTERMQRFLRAFAPMLVKVGRPVEINGHTDARAFPHGSKLDNWDLSYQRADAAREIIVANGVPPSQISGLFARAATQPYVPDNPLASQNRRLSFLLRVSGSSRTAKLEELDRSIAIPPGGPPAKPAADPVDDKHAKPTAPDKHEKPAAAAAPAAAAPAAAAPADDQHAKPAANPADDKHAAPTASPADTAHASH